MLALALFCTGVASAAKGYSYFRVGNTSEVTTATTAATVLMGGGTDVDAAFQWMCQRSGNGHFLVIRAAGTDAYNPYIQWLCLSENSVATLIIPNRTAASDPFVSGTLHNAEALWIAGGNQSNYINFWKGTPVQTALQGLIERSIPIGGTTAGMNVLSQFILFGSGEPGRDFEPGARRSFHAVYHAGSRFCEHRNRDWIDWRSAFCDAGPHGARPDIVVPDVSEWMVRHAEDTME